MLRTGVLVVGSHQQWFFCIVYWCWGLRRGETHIAWHRVWCRWTRCLQLCINIFCLRSFREQHSRAIRKQFSIVPLLYTDWRVQSLRFWCFLVNLRVDFQVWGLDGLLHFYGCILFLPTLVAWSWQPIFIRSDGASRYDRRAPLLQQITWQGEYPLRFRWSQ